MVRTEVGRLDRSERGGAIVEFVLIMPLVFALALGVMTAGAAYARKVSLIDAIREGARYGASLQVPSSGVAAWESSVKARVVQVSGGELTTADVCVKLVYATGAADCGVSDPAGASLETTVRLVKVSGAKSARFEFLFFTMTPTLEAKLAARYERDSG